MSSLQVTKTTNRQELLPFFNNDGCANLFIKLFVPAPAANYSINETSVSDLYTTHQIAYDIMIAKNYDNKPPEMSNNDIHPDFTDFIIRTALFHRSVDKVTKFESSKVLWDDIYMKWDTLSPESQKFYNANLMFMKYTENSWVDILSNGVDKKINFNNHSEYRISFKKKNIKDECPNFYNFIPKIDKKIFNNIWFTDKDGNKTHFDESDSSIEYTNTLKQLYCDVFNGKSDGKFKNLPDKFNNSNYQNKIFNVNVDKLIRRRLYKLHNEVSGKTQSQLPSGPLIDMVYKNIWFRDASGKLYMNDAKGQRIDYGMDDPSTIHALKADNNCFTTLVKVDKNMCTKYMHECLLDADPSGISECIRFWKEKDFYDVSKDEIHKMHPLVALRTLQKFGFREHEVYDTECGKKIKKVETKDHWVKNIMKKKLKDSFVVIEDNDKLLNYLQLLTEYVNANPGILNRDYNGKTMESDGVVSTSDAAQKLGIKMQIVPSNKFNGLIDYTKLKSMISSYHSPIKQQNYNSPTVFQQFGGHGVSTSDLNVNHTKSTYKLLFDIIYNTLKSLKEKGKILDNITIKSIYDQFSALDDGNNDLFETYIYLDKYKNFQELFGDRNSEIVTISNISKLVEKEGLLIATQETNERRLVDILGSLQSLLINQSNNDENKPEKYNKITFDFTQ